MEVELFLVDDRGGAPCSPAVDRAAAAPAILAMARGRREGREEALAGVKEANAAARADRERIEAEVGRMTDEEVDREIREWAR